MSRLDFDGYIVIHVASPPRSSPSLSHRDVRSYHRVGVQNSLELKAGLCSRALHLYSRNPINV